MKPIKLILILFVFSITTFSQNLNYSISGITNKKISNVENSYTIDVGKPITIVSLLSDPIYKSYYIVQVEERALKIGTEEIKNITFNKPTNKEDFWQIIRLTYKADESLISDGYQYDLRKDLEDETIDLLQNLEKFYGFFIDDYLEDYFQGLLFKIHPITLENGRPGNLSIKILKINQPNAFCTPTGTIILTTGLLSTIRSEDELIAVLAHEVAHLVLDHQVVNIKKAIDRQKRADFWAGFATMVAAASEVYLSSKFDYYPVGAATLATAIISTSIASSINDRIGSNYSKEQEWESDEISSKLLTFLNKKPEALSSALSRIKDYCIINGDYLALASSGTHPRLIDRIYKLGEVDPNQFNSNKYDQIISFVNTYNSVNEYGLKHLETLLSLTSRNIDAGVGTEED